MYGLARAKDLNKRGGRIYGLAALAAFVLLTIIPAHAQTQGSGGGAGKVSMRDFSFTRHSPLGLVAGQTVRVTAVNNFLFQDGSVRFVKARVKVYDAVSNLLYQTNEVDIPSGGYYSFDIGYDTFSRQDINDIYVFRSPTGRIELRFEVEFRGGISVAAGQVNDSLADKFPAISELMDDVSGKTIMIGMLLPAIQVIR